MDNNAHNAKKIYMYSRRSVERAINKISENVLFVSDESRFFNVFNPPCAAVTFFAPFCYIFVSMKL